MIVDLVRNDLSKTASKGSVKVEELAEIYTFPSVHQMISTVTSIVNKDVSPVQILESLFPMGSMTGAPKTSTMQIIEDLESTKRGVYSGAFGYFTPHSDFDFNVVIRSVLYNTSNQYLSFSVGGAITSQSNAEQEYQECLLKAKPIIKSLNKFLNKN
jgi:para-aminobenzoate synthetase component 1